MSEIDLRPWIITHHKIGDMHCAGAVRDGENLAHNTLVHTTDQVAELLRRDRERCAKVCDEMFSGQVGAVHVASTRCATAIRALPDEVQP